MLPHIAKKLCFTTLSLIPMISIARLSVVKQSSFGLPGQYGRRVTRVNRTDKTTSVFHNRHNISSGKARLYSAHKYQSIMHLELSFL